MTLPYFTVSNLYRWGNENLNEIHGQYDLVSVLTKRALESVRWLEDIGVEFVRSEVTMPVGALWRRAISRFKPMGYAFISVLQKYVLEHGGKILTDSPVKELLVKKTGCQGVSNRRVETVKPSLSMQIPVVPASGGFGANTKVLQNTIPTGLILQMILLHLIHQL